jgi:hypothetical protein
MIYELAIRPALYFKLGKFEVIFLYSVSSFVSACSANSTVKAGEIDAAYAY